MLVKRIRFDKDLGLDYQGYTTEEGEPNTVKDIVEDMGGDCVYLYLKDGTKVTVKGHPYILFVKDTK